MAKDVIERYGEIDVLINNAGIIKDALVTKMTEENWDMVIDIDLKCPFQMVQAVVENMIEHKIGNIINISSAIVHMMGCALFGSYKKQSYDMVN